jgi:hypothetical protein
MGERTNRPTSKISTRDGEQDMDFPNVGAEFPSEYQQQNEKFVRAMHRGKVPFKAMAEQLNVLRRRRSLPWTVSAIKEVLKRPEKPVLRIEVDPNSIFYDGFGDDIRNRERDALAVEASWDTMAQQFQEALDYIAKQREGEERPVDWRSTDAWSKKGIHLADLYRHLGLSGKDTWSREVLPLFVQQTLRTGKNVMALLDAIKGHGAERAQIKRCIYGVYAALSREMESNAALRLEIKALKKKYEPSWLPEHPELEPDVPRLEPVMTTEQMVEAAKRAEMRLRLEELREWKEGKERSRWWQE